MIEGRQKSLRVFFSLLAVPVSLDLLTLVPLLQENEPYVVSRVQSKQREREREKWEEGEEEEGKEGSSSSLVSQSVSCSCMIIE